MTANGMTCHPYAELFPMLGDDEIRALADDIRQHGLRELITTDAEGRIIDGRNRYTACKLAGVTPAYAPPFYGDDKEVLSLVISKNLKRRHLNESQRAMIAADIANLKPGRPYAPSGKPANRPILSDSPVSQPEAAKMLNVSTRSLRRASRVQKDSPPEVQRAVREGRIRLSAAESQPSNGTRPRQKAKQKAKASRFNDDAFQPLCDQLNGWIEQRFNKAGGAEARDECAKLVGQLSRRIERWQSEKPL